MRAQSAAPVSQTGRGRIDGNATKNITPVTSRKPWIESIPLLDDDPNGGIIVGDRLRQVDDDKVKILAESMATIGLQTPITVWTNGDDSEVHLVAGLHRLRAALLLGWDCIHASVVDHLSEIDRRRWEIAENLHRSELTVLQRDEHVAEWIRLTEESEAAISSQPETKLELPKKHGRPSSGVNAAARELNIEKMDAHRAVKVASLTDEAKEAAREVGLDDNRSALLEAAKVEPENQAEAVREIATKKAAKNAEPAGHQDDDDRPHRWGDPTKHYRYASAAESVKAFVRAVEKEHRKQGGNTKLFMLFHALDLLDLEDAFLEMIKHRVQQ